MGRHVWHEIMFGTCCNSILAGVDEHYEAGAVDQINNRMDPCIKCAKCIGFRATENTNVIAIGLNAQLLALHSKWWPDFTLHTPG